MFSKKPTSTDTPLSKNIILTPRQRDCLQYIADGYTARHIGYRLGISQRMVRFHLEKARNKLGVSSTIQAVYLATKAGLID